MMKRGVSVGVHMWLGGVTGDEQYADYEKRGFCRCSYVAEIE